jgi:hypothetical protein
MSIRWENIQKYSDYYIYSVGYSRYYPNPYWIAGTGIKGTNSSGSSTITDGAYGNAGDGRSVFACLTKAVYDFSKQPAFEFSQAPPCDETSDWIQIK